VLWKPYCDKEVNEQTLLYFDLCTIHYKF
jgi:hypothetical protein